MGLFIVLYRVAVVRWCRDNLGANGDFAGRAIVAVGGYGWLLLGAIGVVLWCFDHLG